MSGLPEDRLTREEMHILREETAALGITAAGSTSSRGASRASSSQGGAARFTLDSGSLAALTHHFERLMDQVGVQLDYLTEQVALAAEVQYDEAEALSAEVEAEMARYEALDAQLIELEEHFDRIRNIRDIVADQRRQVDAAGRDFDRAAADGNPSSRHRDDKGRSSHSHSSKHHSSKHHSSSKKHHGSSHK